MSVVQIENITKTYDGVTALNRLSVDIQGAELFGFIGPDGAGKTTLFRILTTLITPDSGRAVVLGHDVVDDYRAVRPLLGYMPGEFSLYEDLSVRENIHFFASVFGTTLEENYELVSPIYRQLEPFESRLAGALSGGMKQKLALCCALIHQPRLLILDEPTTGVDAVSRQEFWDMLHQLKSEGLTIIASTPYMDEADQCDRIALIDDGNILNIATPETVAEGYEKPLLSVKADQHYRLLQVLRGYEYAQSVQPFGEYIHYTDRRDNPDPEQLKFYLEKHDFSDIEIDPIQPTIEDRFMELMQKDETA